MSARGGAVLELGELFVDLSRNFLPSLNGRLEASVRLTRFHTNLSGIKSGA